MGDDQPQITANPTIQSFQNLPKFFSGSTFYNGGQQQFRANFYRPLDSTFYSLIYTLFGPNAFVFHLVLITLSIANACLVFLIFKQFFRKSIAFILSLIFLIHPINSEVAFYISDMQDVLFLFFGISALLILQSYTSKKFLFMASLLLFFSLLSKETGALFIIIAVIYVYMFMRKYFYRWIIYLLPMIGIYLILRISAIGIFTKLVVHAPIDKLDLLTRSFNMPAIFFFYIKSFIFPLTLSSSYYWVYTHINFSDFFLPLLIDLFFLIVLFYIAFLLYKKHDRKYFSFYIFFTAWFLLGILFHIQILPLEQTVSVRWFYFPVIGVLGIIGCLLDTNHNKTIVAWTFIVTAIIIFLFSVRTMVRSSDWRNNITLANHDIVVSKESYDLEDILGYEYMKEGQFKEAKTHFDKSIKIYPSVEAYDNLGVLYMSQGNYHEARNAFNMALTLGNNYMVYENLASLDILSGIKPDAVNFIKFALSKYPNDAKLWEYLAYVDYKLNNVQEAKIAISTAYTYQKSAEITNIYLLIMNNQPLNLRYSVKP